MKQLILLALIMICSSPLIGQRVYSYIYLVDGDTLAGTIKEYQQGYAVIIEKDNGRKLTIDVADIERISQKQYIDTPTRKKTSKPIYSFREKGIYNILYMSNLIGSTNDKTRFGGGMHNILGYQFHRIFGLGIGGGIDGYSLEDSYNLISAFAELRGYLNKKRIAPYYSVAAGQGFYLKGKQEDIVLADGGIMGRLSLGMRLGASEDANVLVDIGYQFQEVYIEREFDFGELEKTSINFNRLVLRVGLIF